MDLGALHRLVPAAEEADLLDEVWRGSDEDLDVDDLPELVIEDLDGDWRLTPRQAVALVLHELGGEVLPTS